MIKILQKRMPTNVSFKTIYDIENDDDIMQLKNGMEIINQTSQRMKYVLSYKNCDKAIIEEIIGLFRETRGHKAAFLFKDWHDYQVENEVVSKTTGVEQSLPLCKTYGVYKRRIYAPVVSTLVVKVGDQIIDDFHFDGENGVVNLLSPIENLPVTVSCEFDVPVRFNCTSLPIVHEGRNTLSICDFELIEVVL